MGTLVWFRSLSLVRRLQRAAQGTRFWWQRRTRGWDDSALWSLDSHLAQVILPRLRAFREQTCAYPDGMTFEEWQGKLGNMIRAFEFLASEDRWDARPDDPRFAQAQEGLDLFAKWFMALWF